ncbi:hypothetical protein [Streptomyces sp. NPDC029554]|uniref:hypothetical protein n=1 Tax=Streptomyces sp. NPDC029554 TaxID=3155126 RepID=UPI0034056161
MHATEKPRPDNPLDVETFARPEQRRRYIKAMERIAAGRRAGDSIRVYVSAAPRTRQTANWERWLKRITDDLPAGVELLHYPSTFEGKPYDWDALVDRLDGLVVIGRPKRLGSRVHLLGPAARQELRSMIAQKPVLLFTHNLGLVPVIDCLSQVMAPPEAPRLKLTAPKRWSRESATLQAALGALHPTDGTAREGEVLRDTPRHLTAPFTVATG